jgi:hypothetical protein
MNPPGMTEQMDEPLEAAPTQAQGPPMPVEWKMDPDKAQSLFSNTDFLREAAMIAAKSQRPELAMQWLERAHGAAKEHAFEAVGALMKDDIPGAVTAFNRAGQFRDVTGAVKNADGTYTVTRKGGQQQTLNPVKEYESLLSPQAFIQNKRLQEELVERRGERAERRTLAGQELQIRKDTLTETRRHHGRLEDNREAAIEAREREAELREQVRYTLGLARAAASGRGGTRGTGAGGGEEGELAPKDALKAWEKARDQAQKEVGADATPADIARHTSALMVAATGRPEQSSKGKWVITAATPTGKRSVVLAFDTEQQAREAYQQILASASVPAQGTLMNYPIGQQPGVRPPASPSSIHGPPLPNPRKLMPPNVLLGAHRRRDW